MAVQITKVKDRIAMLLKEHSHLRDSDSQLRANLWYQEIRKIEPFNEPENDLLVLKICGLIAEDKLTDPESIRRSRAKLQEKYPELRGDKYNERHKNEEKIIQELREVWPNSNK